MKNAISYFVRKITDFAVRRRSPALALARLGFYLVMAALGGGWLVSAKHQGTSGIWELSYYASSTPQLISLIAFVVGVLAFISGSIWEIVRYLDERKLNSKRKTIVIEQRGLVDTSDTPLSEYIKDKCSWQVDSLVIDIRERIIDNVITSPETAFIKVSHLKMSLAEKTAQYAASDISIAYGGVFPVPFAFYTGYLLDDESKITVYDWERDDGVWNDLDGDDEGEQFVIEQPTVKSKAVVLALSVSYLVDRQAVASVFNGMPVHYLTLPTIDRNNHWSKGKQDRLSGDFLEYCKTLLGQGVEHIHLVLASQNSVAFRFGQAYDKRNLPSVSVYQYERYQPMRYPWYVNIPHEVGEVPSVVQTEFKQVA
ncbi:SAVED domain-containing protein [Alteromonas australica]|uniref:SAVED domain-containing protein n=1 Tax=Alteromonas australica TaxID=589873 RepID=UPI0035C7BA7C